MRIQATQLASVAPRIAIRQAGAQDAGAACMLLRRSILQSCARDHGQDRLILEHWLANKTPATVAGWIASPGNHCLLALHGDSVAGVAILTRKGRIALLHVHPELLLRGIGTSLLRALEAQARAWGLANLRVDSTLSARAFFVRQGYATGVTVRAAYGAGAIRLAKRLAPAQARKPACACVQEAG